MRALIFILLSICLFNSCEAACQRGGDMTANKNISVSSVSLPANIVVESRNYSPGEVVWSQGPITGSNSNLTITGCSNGYHVGFLYTGGGEKTASVDANGIVPTNIAGLGLRIYAQNQGGNYDGKHPIDNAFVSGDGSDKDHTLKNSAYFVELVATGGKITGGQLTFASPIAQVEFSEDGSESGRGDIASQLNLSSTNVAVKAMGCTADVSELNFDFGKVDINEFESKTTVGGAPDQTINLACEPGTNISFYIQGPLAQGNNPNHSILGIMQGGLTVASGVGIQIDLKAGSYDSAGKGIPLNSFLQLFTSTRDGDTITGGAAANEALTFSAKVAKVEDDVTVGKVNTFATMSLSYN
ncbi:type 1 fimbrial protein [Buttiauxella brennerae]|nr:type 1 fimbrial protein [Buttiauxella brennerae]